MRCNLRTLSGTVLLVVSCTDAPRAHDAASDVDLDRALDVLDASADDRPPADIRDASVDGDAAEASHDAGFDASEMPLDAQPDDRADAAAEPAVDVTPELARDVALDAALDALPDAALDAPREVGVDAPREVGVDAPREVGVDALDAAAGPWTLIGPTPAIRFDETTAMWTGREVIFWGARAAWTYTPATATWSPLPATGAPLGFSLPGAVYAALWDAAGARMLTIGGVDTTPPVDEPIHAWDPRSGAWSPVAPIGPLARRTQLGAALGGGRLFAYGGALRGTTVYFFDSGGLLDLAASRWTTLDGAGLGAEGAYA